MTLSPRHTYESFSFHPHEFLSLSYSAIADNKIEFFIAKFLLLFNCRVLRVNICHFQRLAGSQGNHSSITNPRQGNPVLLASHSLIFHLSQHTQCQDRQLLIHMCMEVTCRVVLAGKLAFFSNDAYKSKRKQKDQTCGKFLLIQG